MAILVDTGPLIAYADRTDRPHLEVVPFFESPEDLLIVPVTVIPEACYFFETYLGVRAEATFVGSLASGELSVEHVAAEDLARCVQLLLEYADNPIGFVDASIVAIAERLNISTILTLDHRHFGAVRPKHIAGFRLVP